MNTPLSTFSVALARLILCGGGGLAPAWGPLHHIGTHEADRYPWDPTTQRASGLQGYLYDDGGRIECWSLPLDTESPWPARLALVAAWMVVPPTQRKYIAAANIETTPSSICHRVWLGGGSPINYEWDLHGAQGACSWRSLRVPLLPTLPQHLQTHPPAVALVLALWDVPEIRVRVETA